MNTDAAFPENPKPARELTRCQFSLRRMFIATTAVAILFAFAAWGGWVKSDAVVYLAIAVLTGVFWCAATCFDWGRHDSWRVLARGVSGRIHISLSRPHLRSEGCMDIRSAGVFFRCTPTSMRSRKRLVLTGLASPDRTIHCRHHYLHLRLPHAALRSCRRVSRGRLPPFSRMFSRTAMVHRRALAARNRRRRDHPASPKT